MIYKSKKAISDVVATMLIILIAIAAVTILWNVIKPSITSNLNKGKECYDLREYFKVLDSEYTYYTDANTSVMIERGSENITTKGFLIGLSKEGGLSQRYEINGSSITNVKMMNGTSYINLELPKPGEARTYLFTNFGNASKARIAVIRADGTTCESYEYPIPIKIS